jgi:sulfur carrier protein
VRIWLNGQSQEVEAGTVAELVARLTSATKGVAVAVDDTVVPRSEWARTELRAGTRVEVLVATQGG